MALPFTHVSAVTTPMINESIADNVFNANPLLEHLLAVGSVIEDGSHRIQLPIFNDDTNAAGSFQKYDVLDTTPNENVNACYYEWRREYAQVIISTHELLQNSGKSMMANLLKGKVKNAMQTLKKNLSTRIFSTNGDSSTAMNGLRQIVKASGAIGNVDATDFAGWASDIDASTSTLTYAAMEQSLLDASVGNEGPDIIVTSKFVYKKYKDLAQAAQRFSEGKTAKAGFKYVLFDEIPVFWDASCPGTSGAGDNHMFFLSSKWLYLYIHKDDKFKVVDVGPLANQDVFIQRITFTGQLATDNRRMHSAMTVLNH